MWHFQEQSPGHPTRDPIVGEFFSTAAIANPAEALIREGIQNSLDATIDGQTVRIRIVLGTGAWTLPASTVSPWLESAWPHVHTKGNGLRDQPARTDACPYLTFEDFGTSGLTGSTTQPFDEPGSRNLFFYYFRAEGRSSKSEKDRGRWGVGKHVFPRASKISATFGLTVRVDDHKQYLMGHAILKSHKLNGRHFTPDAYFGIRGPNELVLPIDSPAFLDRFRSTFRLSRSHEPGLSIVVPFLDEEFTPSALATGVIKDYFHPILKGALAVRIESPEATLDITASKLVDVALELESEAQAELLQLVDLAEFYSSGRDPDGSFELNPCDPSRPEWNDSLVPEDVRPGMRQRLDEGKRLYVRCHLTVREKNRDPEPSFFDVCLRQDGCESGRAVFVRDGIVISDVKSPRTRGIRSLVIVEDKALATLLGDSENPAHTQWQKDSSNFKGKYTFGKSFIDFVSRAPFELVQRIRAEEDSKDRTVLIDFFSIPAEDPTTSPVHPETRPVRPGDQDSDKEIDPIEPRRRRFAVHRVNGGFSIGPGDVEASMPARLVIRLAYDVRRGNPLKRYNQADFRVDQAPIALDPPPRGVSLVSLAGNEIVADVTQPAFHLTVVGFDEKRDLLVNARFEEGSDAA